MASKALGHHEVKDYSAVVFGIMEGLRSREDLGWNVRMLARWEEITTVLELKYIVSPH